MKKITLLLLCICAGTFLYAQTGFQTIINDGFESTAGTSSPYANGFPTAFSATKQTIWTSTGANNPAPASTAVWKQIFSSNTTANNKDYNVSSFQEEGAGVSGNSQCLKFSITENSFNNGAASFVVRLQSLDNIVSFATGETSAKYEAKFWAKTDGSTRKMILNGTGDTLTITPTWTQYTLSRYVTGLTSTALAIDFCRQPDKVNYVMYMDGFTLAQKPVMVVNAPSAITSTGFTANWTAISGATSYRLALQTSTDGTNWTNPITPITISNGAATSYTFSDLTPNTLYQYRLTATDGLTTTGYPAWVQATTSFTTDINEVVVKSIFARDGQIIVNTAANHRIEVFNCLGKLESSILSQDGQNILSDLSKGLHIVKVGNQSYKIML